VQTFWKTRLRRTILPADPARRQFREIPDFWERSGGADFGEQFFMEESPPYFFAPHIQRNI